jgi:hypothetical protein
MTQTQSSVTALRADAKNQRQQVVSWLEHRLLAKHNMVAVDSDEDEKNEDDGCFHPMMQRYDSKTGTPLPGSRSGISSAAAQHRSRAGSTTNAKGKQSTIYGTTHEYIRRCRLPVVEKPYFIVSLKQHENHSPLAAQHLLRVLHSHRPHVRSVAEPATEEKFRTPQLFQLATEGLAGLEQQHAKNAAYMSARGSKDSRAGPQTMPAAQEAKDKKPGSPPRKLNFFKKEVEDKPMFFTHQSHKSRRERTAPNTARTGHRESEGPPSGRMKLRELEQAMRLARLENVMTSCQNLIREHTLFKE